MTENRNLYALTLGAAAAMLAAAWLIFVYAPQDAVEGPVQRIFYLHVGSALAAFGCFALVLDEPDASLDAEGRALLAGLLQGRTVVMATHVAALARERQGGRRLPGHRQLHRATAHHDEGYPDR